MFQFAEGGWSSDARAPQPQPQRERAHEPLVEGTCRSFEKDVWKLLACRLSFRVWRQFRHVENSSTAFSLVTKKISSPH